MTKAAIVTAAMVLGACSGNSLQVAGAGHPAVVSFDTCRPCHAMPAPMTTVFDANSPDDFRAAVRKVLTEEKTAHPFQPDQQQWNALMIWTDQT
jgi:hypothetical protein